MDGPGPQQGSLQLWHREQQCRRDSAFSTASSCRAGCSLVLTREWRDFAGC